MICPRRGVVLLVALIGLQVVSVVLEAQQTGLLSSNGNILSGLVDLPQLRLSGAFAEENIPGFWKLCRWNYTLYLPLAFVLFLDRVLRLRWLVVIVVVALISAILKFTGSSA